MWTNQERWNMCCATHQQPEVYDMCLDVVCALGRHLTEELQLDRAELSKHHREWCHPLNAHGDVRPL